MFKPSARTSTAETLANGDIIETTVYTPDQGAPFSSTSLVYGERPTFEIRLSGQVRTFAVLSVFGCGDVEVMYAHTDGCPLAARVGNGAKLHPIELRLYPVTAVVQRNRRAYHIVHDSRGGEWLVRMQHVVLNRPAYVVGFMDQAKDSQVSAHIMEPHNR